MSVVQILFGTNTHVAWGWALLIPGIRGKVVRWFAVRRIKSHAPWLNAEAIAYRRAISRPLVNGFYVS